MSLRVKERIEGKALDTADQLRMQTQMKYLHWLCKEESIDMETAIAIVSGRVDPPEPEYSLGYKLSDPVLCIALWGQVNQEKRRSAADNFKKTLTPAEITLFEDEVFQDKNLKKFRKSLISRKRGE